MTVFVNWAGKVANMKYFLVVVALFLFCSTPVFAGALVYEQTATTTAQTSNRFQTVIDCDVLDSTISEMWFWFSDRNVVSTSTLTIDGATTSVYKHPVNNTQQWHQLPFTSDFDCSAGQGQILVQMVGSAASGGSYSVRGESGFNSTQVSGTIYSSNGTSVATTGVKVAIKIFEGEPPPEPPPVRPVTPPPSLETGLVTRYSTSTCSVVASDTVCVLEYIPEFYYLDWLLVNLFIIFLLSFTAIGFFMNRTLK